MKSRKFTYAFLMIALLSLVGCSSSDDAQNGQVAKYVKIEKISNLDMRDKLVFSGFIKEKSLNTIAFRVGGLLQKLEVNTGDYVKQGDLIASLDKRDYELQLEASKAQYEQVKEEYARYQKLFELNKIPANTYEKIKSGYLMAKTSFENAENQLKDAELRAPFSGFVHEKLIENHQMVGAGQPVISIIDVSELEAVISVSETHLSKLKKNQKSYLIVKNSDAGEIPISFSSIGEKTKDDGLYEVKYKFKNNQEMNVYPGMTAELHLICGDATVQISAPVESVFNEKEQNYVWVYDNSNHQIKKRKVVLGRVLNEGRIEILNGLNVNETIVIAGVHSLVEDQKVQPIKGVSKSNIGGLL